MRVKGKQVLNVVLLSVGAFTMILPFYWMIATSLKTAATAVAQPPVWVPIPPHVENYFKALQVAPFGQYFINSVIVTAFSTIGEAFTSILAAFAFSRLNFRGRDLLFTAILATLMVPGELLIIPNFETLTRLGWIDTYLALIVPWLASAFSVFQLKQRFQSIPDELYYAAKVDGSSDWQFLWEILVPMSRSSVVTMVILKVIGAWNSFFWPLLVTNEASHRTLPVGLQAFTSEAGTNFELLMAASAIVILPMIIFYFIFQKYIVRGVASTGTKG